MPPSACDQSQGCRRGPVRPALRPGGPRAPNATAAGQRAERTALRASRCQGPTRCRFPAPGGATIAAECCGSAPGGRQRNARTAPGDATGSSGPGRPGAATGFRPAVGATARPTGTRRAFRADQSGSARAAQDAPESQGSAPPPSAAAPSRPAAAVAPRPQPQPEIGEPRHRLR